MWDDYQVFLITPLVITRLLLNEIFYIGELAFGWLIDDDDGMFFIIHFIF